MNSTLAKNWSTYPLIPEEIEQRLEPYPRFLRQVLYNRGIITKDQAEAYLSAKDPLYDPFMLSGMERAVNRLLLAIDQKEKIAVYGDYDVDGVTATALMVQVLQKFSAIVDKHIPNRFDEGYGLNVQSIEKLAEKDGVKVILTVDCGIRSPREAEFAREKGIDLIISDHHFPQELLPNAYAIICPKQVGDQYPFKELAGVGLAYKIAQALFKTRKLGELSADDWLDLVALGTVSDLVPLVDENRALARKGLQQIRYGHRIGIRALCGAADIKDISRITATDIGFKLGPRLNAAGRMETAENAYNLLMAENSKDAGELALYVDKQNSSRQNATRAAQEKAEEIFARSEQANLIAVFDEEFSPGIVGLVASKLVEQHYRPSIVGSFEGEFIKASCRSIPEFHITQALDECADILIRYGGHSMAAGFTVHKDYKDQLIERLKKNANSLDVSVLKPTLKIDVELRIEEVTNQIYPELEKLQPTGMGNPTVVLALNNVKIEKVSKIGRDQNHLRFSIPQVSVIDKDKNRVIKQVTQAIAFNQAHWYDDWLSKKVNFDLAFTIDINSYNGIETHQIQIKDMKPSGM